MKNLEVNSVIRSIFILVMIFGLNNYAVRAQNPEKLFQEAVMLEEAPAAMLVVIWLAALSNVYFGLVTGLPRELATKAATLLLRHLP